MSKIKIISTLLFTSLLFIGCSTTQKIEALKPPPSDDTPMVFNTKASYVNMPLEITLAEIENQLNKALTGDIYSDTDIEKDKTELKITKTGAIQLREINGKIETIFPLKIWAKFKYGIDFMGLNDTKEVNLNGILTVTSDVKLSNWKLETNSNINDIQWTESPSINIAGKNIPITYIINPAISIFKAKISTKIDEAIQKTCDFKPQVLNVLEKMSAPFLMSEQYQTWFKLIPLEVHVTDAILSDSKIKMNLGLKCNESQILKEYQKNVECKNNPFKRIILLSKTIYYFTLIKQIPLGKNLYVHIEPEEIVSYENMFANLKEKGNGTRVPILPAYKILPLAAIYYIDKENYLSLFKLKRDTIDIKNAYNYQWLYHASFAPIWKERIEKFHGYIDKINKIVIFNEIEDSDDNLQAFYDEFGYEPDEQKTDIQIRTIQEIRNVRDWTTFYKDHKNVGVVEIEDEILSVFDKIVY